MTMPDLLLELRSEEIPARMQRKAAGDLKKLVTDGLVEAGLADERVVGGDRVRQRRHVDAQQLGEAHAREARGERVGGARGPRTDLHDLRRGDQDDRAQDQHEPVHHHREVGAGEADPGVEP